MNRRDFTSGSFAHTAGQLLAPWIDHTPLAVDAPLLCCARRAMATTFEVMLPVGTPGGSTFANGLFDLIDDIETQLTIYSDDSEVADLNRRAPSEEVIVEPALFDLLQEAARLTRDTGGAFDVTAGPLIKTWGFFRRKGRVPSPIERLNALKNVGMKHVELFPERRGVRFHRPGVEINLGSIGKGYAIDRAIDRISDRGIGSALFHAGGSSIRVLGRRPGDPHGWPVGIRHPWQDARRFAVVNLRDRAMGTSAATFQHFEYKGRKLGHLIDPRTGCPAEGIASATALAPTAAEADALATAFFVLGVEKARLYCAAHPEIGAVLLPDGEEQPVVLNLTDEDIELQPVG